MIVYIYIYIITPKIFGPMEIYSNKLQDELLSIYSSKSDCSESRDGFGFNDAFFRL